MKKINISPQILFMLFIIPGFFLSIIFLLSTHGQAFDYSIFNFGSDRFMDFFNHIFYCTDPKQVYYVNYNACFPPLAYAFFYFLNLILPVDSVEMWNAFTVHSYALLLYVLFVSVSAILLYYCTSKYLTSHSQEFKLFFCIIIFFSNILLFNVIERGGLTLYISIFLLLSLHLKDTNSKYKRELALIFIAIAAGIKIYPAIFGLIYIIEKRYKEAARLVIYGLISFFYPSYFLVDIMDSCSFYPSRICYNYPALVQQQPPCHIFFFL